MVKDHRQQFQICSVAKRKTTSIHTQKKSKRKNHNQSTEQHKLKDEELYTSKKQWDRLEFTLFFSHHVGLLKQPTEHFSLREAGQMSAESWILNVAGR